MNKERQDTLRDVYAMGQEAMAMGKSILDWSEDEDQFEDWDAGMTSEWRRGFWDAEDGAYDPLDCGF